MNCGYLTIWCLVKSIIAQNVLIKNQYQFLASANNDADSIASILDRIRALMQIKT